MRKNLKTVIVAAGALVLLGLIVSAPQAQARPQYLKQFAKQYPDLIDAAKMRKCLICHPGKDKKMRNDYGQAVADGLGKNEDGEPVENEKAPAKIEAALKKAEEAKSKKHDKTFGEMIEEGKLPE